VYTGFEFICKLLVLMSCAYSTLCILFVWKRHETNQCHIKVVTLYYVHCCIYSMFYT